MGSEEILTEEKVTSVEIQGVLYEVAKTGRGQAEQIASFSRWLSKYAVPVFSGMAENEEERELGTQNYLVNILSNLSADALVELFSIVTGCSKKVADEHFEFGILIDSVLIFWDNQPGIQKLVNRFFSTPT